MFSSPLHLFHPSAAADSASLQSARDKPRRSDRPSRTPGNPGTNPDAAAPNRSLRSPLPPALASTESVPEANRPRAPWPQTSDRPADIIRNARTPARGHTSAHPAAAADISAPAAQSKWAASPRSLIKFQRLELSIGIESLLQSHEKCPLR